MIETNDGGGFEQIMTKQELGKYVAAVKTMYKRKDKKIRPANVPLPGGVNPGGRVNLEVSQQLAIGNQSELSAEGRTVPEDPD
jgi:hypothetical protein